FALLPPGVDVVVKIDADVTFETDHLERLLAAFERDSRLGIASGIREERLREGWCPQHSTSGDPEAQCRAYRLECLTRLLPFEERLGWDTIDLARANALGWRTASVRDVAFRHHRPLGARDGSRWRAWYAQGKA